MLEQPDIIQAVHRDFIAAGARIITLNTYTATLPRLQRDGDPDRFGEIHTRAIQAAQAAREQAPHPVQLAGCLPPLIGSYAPGTAPSYEACLTEYRRIVAQQAAHVDLFLIETISELQEGLAAAVAAGESGKPVLLSFTVQDHQGNALRSGEPLAEVVSQTAGYNLAGLMVNCSVPEAVEQAMGELKQSPFPFGGYANGFISVDALKPGGTVDVLSARHDLTPEVYAEHALRWVKQGATLVGGCCEVGPEHIAALHQRLLAEGYAVGTLREPHVW